MRAHATRLLPLVAAIGLLVLFAARVDWTSALAHLSRMGARAPLVLLPYACVLCCDTLGWRASFEHPRLLRYAQLYRIRVATEAVANSLPAGIALGEMLKTVLLRRMLGIELPEAAANVIVSKFSLAFAQGLFLCAGVALSLPLLTEKSVALIGRPGLAWIGLGVAGALLAALFAIVALVQAGLASRLLAQLVNLANEPWRSRLSRWERPFAALDRGLAVVGRVPRTQVITSIGMFLCGWFLLGFEDWFILSLLAQGVSLAKAISIEAVISIVRVVFCFVPSALGAQELGYYALFGALGLPDAQAVATAFMLVKRSKELCWIGGGYALLSFLPVRGTELQSSRQTA